MADTERGASEAARFSRQRSLGYVVNHVARLFSRALEQRLAPHGMSRGQFPLLLILWEQEGITQSEIARRLDIEQPTVANTLQRMERDGLISTAPDPGHRRQVLISLTEKARALKPAATAGAADVNDVASAELSAEDIETLFALMERMRAGLARQMDHSSG